MHQWALSRHTKAPVCTAVVNFAGLLPGYFTEARRSLDWLNGTSNGSESRIFIFLSPDIQDPDDTVDHGDDIEKIRIAFADSKMKRVTTKQM